MAQTLIISCPLSNFVTSEEFILPCAAKILPSSRIAVDYFDGSVEVYQSAGELGERLQIEDWEGFEAWLATAQPASRAKKPAPKATKPLTETGKDRLLRSLAKAMIEACGSHTYSERKGRDVVLSFGNSDELGPDGDAELNRIDRSIEDLNEEIYILVTEKGYRA